MEKFLTGSLAPSARVKAIAEAEDFHLYPSVQKPQLASFADRKFSKPMFVVADSLDDNHLGQLISMPIDGLIDAQSLDDSIHTFVSTLENNELPSGLSFLLTCPVVYKGDIASVFVRALNNRLSLTDSRAAGIHIALHEAIVNGLIHGNFQISSDYRQSAEKLIEYSKILKERLQDPAFTHKSICISAHWDESKLEILVRDEGAGYSMREAEKNKDNLNKPQCKSGRGLLFIAGTADSCTIDNYGREVLLTFGLKDEYQEANTVYTRQSREEEKETSYSRPSVENCRVLIIEDNLSNQTMLYRLLNVIGINQIDTALDGIEGLEKVASFKPDLIILDITMPRMNGYEVLKQLRGNPETQNIPVLIETASDTREARDKTFRTGATDFITKPINPLEFFSRIKVHLENRMLISHLEKQLEQIESELASAQRMQRTILPTDVMLANIRERYGLNFGYHFEPSSRLGGDFWQLIPLTEKKVAVYICDFSGHGISAALNTFRLHALVTQMDHINIEIPASAMAMLNAQLLTMLPRGQFATFFLGVIDLAKDEMMYASAGIPRPILMQGDGTVQILSAEGMPLGISKQAQYENIRVPFTKNARFLLYSDALSESPNTKGARLGEDGFAKMALKHFDAPSAAEYVHLLMKDFFKYAPPPPPDDVTVVAIKRER